MNTNDQPTPERRESSLERMRRLQTTQRASVSDRVAKLHSAYIISDRDRVIGERIEEMIDHCLRVQDARESGNLVGRLAEARPLMVLGESGSGKTRSLTRIFRRRQEFEGYGDRSVDCPLLSVDVPSPCTMRMLGMATLQAAGYPVTRELREAEVWQIVPAVLKQRGVYFLHFDEVGHVLQCHNPIEIQKVRNTFKSLMQSKDWPVWLILSGTPDIAALTQDPADEQVWRRALPLYIEDIDLKKDAKLVRDAMLGLGQDKGELDVPLFSDDSLIARLIHAAINRFGIVIELIQDAVENALHGGAKRLEVRHFAEAYKRRTGCDPDSNVFTQDIWEKIDPRLALRRRDGELYAPVVDEPVKKRRRRK
ncbi:TniB family NTP-binding protein [Azorhizobium sp. AG788]|uniref:TniB family NTP-binding protein n=1 Tax=Azorhizobium sp. AG788 TaxID=2183897 RepID=UPI0031388140